MNNTIPLYIAENNINADIIHSLEHTLELTKQGDIEGYVIIAKGNFKNRWYENSSGDINLFETLGMFSIAVDSIKERLWCRNE